MVRILPAIIDLILVIGFAVVGRASHSEGLSLFGIAQTGWPFFVACAAGWIVVSLLEDSGYGPRSALVIWLVTVLAGMGLRIAAGDTAEPAFVLVATAILFSAFFGWRLVARGVRARTGSTT